jgi:anti-sigma factor RsiW
MPCQELVELVTDYLDGALGLIDRRRFEEHLAECSDCVEYLALMRETMRLTGERLREEMMPPGMRDLLLSHFRSWSRESG